MNPISLFKAVLAILAIAPVSLFAAASPQKPNIIFILADDIGYGDLGCYGATLDACVGELLGTLERLKLADNTLFIFTSDNGGVNDDGYEDFDPSAHKMNGALRGKKGTLFEGGHRVPFVARWPGKIKAGAACDELISLIDMMPSFAALTDVTLPPDAAPDGINVLAVLLGQLHDMPRRNVLVMHNGGINGPFAIRQGAWKLIQNWAVNARPAEGGARTPQLFNLADDLGESENLADRNPEKLKELAALLQQVRGKKQRP